MGSTLRIVSANLWNGGARPEAFAAQVEALAADVVAVQELSPEQADALSEVMPYGELEPARNHCGMGLVARCPGELDRIPLSLRDGRVMRLYPAHWPGLERPVEIVNLHFCAPHVFRPVVGLHMRRVQMAEFETFLSEEGAGGLRDSRVLVGDFNATPLWPLYGRVARHFEDAAVVVAKRRGENPAKTWGPWPGAPRLLRIDHGFVRGLEVESFRVVPIESGDHSAIVVDLRIA